MPSPQKPRLRRQLVLENPADSAPGEGDQRDHAATKADGFAAVGGRPWAMHCDIRTVLLSRRQSPALRTAPPVKACPRPNSKANAGIRSRSIRSIRSRGRRCRPRLCTPPALLLPLLARACGLAAVFLCVSLFAVQLVALAKRAFTVIRISAEDDPELAIRGTNRPGVTSAIPVGRVC